MHKLAREVRFSINPFLPEDGKGFNSYCSAPVGEGLSIFFELGVGLAGEVELATGFVVNVVDVDRCVRQYVVPVFAERIRKYFRQGKHIGFFEIAELLESAQEQLTEKFGKAMVAELSLKLNPFRKVAVDCEDMKMIYFSERFEFAAMHKLWNDEFTESRNFEVFGKCANPTGHGHNYIVEVTVKMPTGGDFCISDFEKTVDNELIKLIDHKNLNADVAYFEKTNPTVENISVFAWEHIVGKFIDSKLHSITVWETDKTYCTYYG
ncbi:MAG: 6-carboxytetrahydropterin synthase [Planctomycetota bacterium]|jgi:6-pyruvoyltetrahydropterin/6-carboxytetrahydropterin synthase